jgi:NAD-dependent SIR2 family protein deacetylase
MDQVIEQARAAIQRADALVITAGAGMGVDSGLPDFRGDEGFWRAYPPLQKLGLGFQQMANPAWFTRDPTLAWGFYGHRLNLYRATIPHAGFSLLRALTERMPRGAFAFTSNVDGQFHRAGMDADHIMECHGSIHHLQCTRPCTQDLWDAADTQVTIDPESFRAVGELPTCPRCGALARPNILMFGDGAWIGQRSDAQHDRLSDWLGALDGATGVVLEFGAGTAIPSVRRFGEQLQEGGFTLIRVNPRESHGPVGTLSIASGALAACQALLHA